MSKRFYSVFSIRFAIALVVLMALFWAFAYQLYVSRKEVAYSTAKESLSRVEVILDTFIDKTYMMEGFLHSFGEDKMRHIAENMDSSPYHEEFQLFAAMLYDSSAIMSLDLLPNGRLYYIYPDTKIKRKAFGYSVFDYYRSKKGAALARDTGELQIEGPRELMVGGTSFIVRNPVYYEDGSFWGFTSIVLQLPEVVEPFGLNDLVKQGYEYQFEVANDAGEDVVLTSTISEGHHDSLVVASRMIAGHNTTLKLIPANGWLYLRHAVYILFFFVTLAGVLGYMSARNKMAEVELLISLENEKHLREMTALAYKEAEQANTAKSDFLSAMSHDLRTPMNAIVGLCTLLAREAKNPQKVLDYVRKLNGSSQHLLGLINDILDMSKIESGKVSLNEREFSLASLIENINTIVRPQARARHQVFDIIAEGIEHEMLIADDLRLNQIILNLLSNAIKYTQIGGHICLRVTEVKKENATIGSYTFEISDNGMGMSEEFVKHIFEPFVRSDNVQNTAIQGTGLGMAITHNLIKLMGGTIDIESHEGEGTKVTVIISMKIKHEEMHDSEYFANCGIKNVLLIDDESTTYDAVSATLSDVGLKTKHVICLTDALQTLEESLLANEAIDLIVLDWKLGVENGVEVAKKIKESAYKDTPIFMLTAFDFEEVQVEAMSAGISAFLRKPLFITNLKQAIESSRQHSDHNDAKKEVSVLSGLKILAAENNELNSEILVDILSLQGAQCHVCKDGREIVETFKQTKPGDYDFILMDVQMPFLNGLDATREIRKLDLPHAKSIPIIAMTANAFCDDIQASLDAGMNFHISKPIDLRLLETTVRKLTINPDARGDVGECRADISNNMPSASKSLNKIAGNMAASVDLTANDAATIANEEDALASESSETSEVKGHGEDAWNAVWEHDHLAESAKSKGFVGTNLSEDNQKTIADIVTPLTDLNSTTIAALTTRTMVYDTAKTKKLDDVSGANSTKSE